MMQFEPDPVGQRPLGGLGGAVGRVEGIGEETGDREHVDDRAAAGRRQHGRERPAHAQRAEVVDLHLLPGRVQVRCAGEGAVPQHPGVVHQQADVGALRGDPGDLLAVGDVQGDRQHTGFGDLGGIAGGPVDLGRAPADQFPGEGPAQSPVGPADQGDGSADVHEGSPGHPLTGRAGRPLLVIRRIRASLRALTIIPPVPSVISRGSAEVTSLARRTVRCCTTCPAGITSTAAYDVNVPFMQLGRHEWDIHAV